MERRARLKPAPRSSPETHRHRAHSPAYSAGRRRAFRRSIIWPFLYLGISDDPSLHLQCAQNFIRNRIPKRPPPLWSGEIWRNDKIRIAYLSADFCRHPMGYLMPGLFERHDRTRFEVIAVSFGPDDGSEARQRLVKASDRFIDVQTMSDADVARLLHEMQVDIVIDRKGYTAGCRPEILAHRPAPIQVSYLAYPGTLGADFVDYVLGDTIVTPFEHQPFFTEKIVQLPGSYQVNDATRKIGDRTWTRREAGLPERDFVFCCFNNNYKITAPVFRIWMRLLQSVKDSVLWLIEDSSETKQSILQAASTMGIDPARIVFAPRLDHEDHLARHRLADLFLDTLPYNAHSTASDALWAGLPVLTYRGAAFAGRVAASLLHAIGLPELVTESLDDYEALALKMATEPAALSAVRQKLAQNRLIYPLFDTDRSRRHIEAAYIAMWDRWQRGESPGSFECQPMATPPDD